MKIENLMEVLPETYNLIDRELVMRAYHFAEHAHEGQKRASGEPYITHSVAVAAILAEMRVPPVLVVAGLLHDTVEDTSVTLNDIRAEFGDEAANLVDGVTKLTNLPRVSRGDQHPDEVVLVEDDSSEPVLVTEGRTDNSGRVRRKDLRNETLRKTFLAMGDDVRVVLI